jgi:folate-binding protein YgfZ
MHTLADRAIIRLSPQSTGENVRDFLQGLVTQDTKALMPLWAALLSPQGKVFFDFVLWDSGDDILIDCEATQAEALVRRLSMYRLRRKIAIAVDSTLAVFWSHDPVNGVPDPRLHAMGCRVVASVNPDAEDASAAYRAHRLSLGITEGVAELGSDQTLWLECNAADLNGVSFAKGCYVGQENTARMNWRQKVSRRLVVVPIDKADPARTRITYPELGVAVVHMRVEDVDIDLLPDWLRTALPAEKSDEHAP